MVTQVEYKGKSLKNTGKNMKEGGRNVQIVIINNYQKKNKLKIK